MILDFEVEDVDRYHKALVDRGVIISRAPEDQSFGLRMMYVYDPDGYNLSLCAEVTGKEDGLEPLHLGRDLSLDARDELV